MCKFPPPHPSQCHTCDVRPRSTVFLTPVCPSWQRCGDLQCFYNEAELKNEPLFQVAGVVWRSKKPLSVIPSSKKEKKKENGPPSVAALVLLLWNAIQFLTRRRDQRTQQFSPTAHYKRVFSSGAAVRVQFGTHIWAILWSPCGLLTVGTVASI